MNKVYRLYSKFLAMLILCATMVAVSAIPGNKLSWLNLGVATLTGLQALWYLACRAAMKDN